MDPNDPQHPYNFRNFFTSMENSSSMNPQHLSYSPDFSNLYSSQSPMTHHSNAQNFSSNPNLYSSQSPITPTSHGSSYGVNMWSQAEGVASLDDIQDSPLEANHARGTRGGAARGRATRGRGARGRSARGRATGERGARNSWSKGEDLLLISGWINTTTDGRTNTQQTAGAFWQRVADYYNTNRDEDWPERVLSTVKPRWYTISSAVSKFVGCYASAKNRQGSGENDCDVMRNAHTIYKGDHGNDFLFEHAWRELKTEPKFHRWVAANATPNEGGSKRTKVNEFGSYTSTEGSGTPSSVSGSESTPVRPEGIKAMKRKGKQVVGSSSDSASREAEEVVRGLFEQGVHMNAQAESDKAKAAHEYAVAQKTILLNKLIMEPNLNDAQLFTRDSLIKELFGEK